MIQKFESSSVSAPTGNSSTNKRNTVQVADDDAIPSEQKSSCCS